MNHLVIWTGFESRRPARPMRRPGPSSGPGGPGLSRTDKRKVVRRSRIPSMMMMMGEEIDTCHGKDRFMVLDM